MAEPFPALRSKYWHTGAGGPATIQNPWIWPALPAPALASVLLLPRFATTGWGACGVSDSGVVPHPSPPPTAERRVKTACGKVRGLFLVIRRRSKNPNWAG